MKRIENEKAVVFVLAPTGRDAVLAVSVLEKAGIRAEVCPRLETLIAHVGTHMAAALIAEEAILPAQVPILTNALAAQPPWSDIPVVVLTVGGADAPGESPMRDVLSASANVTLLERPLRSVTLVSTAQTALRARSRQYQVRDLIEQQETTLASISDAFSAINRSWCYTYVNAKAAEFAHLAKEQMIGRVIWEIYPQVIGSEFYHRAHAAMANRTPDLLEFFYEPWGRWLETRIYPSAEGLVIFRTDVTDRKNAEMIAEQRDVALQESEDRLRLAIAAGDLGTWDFNPLTQLLRWSARCKELFGLPPDAEVNYETFLAGLHPEDRQRADAAVQAALRPGGDGKFDMEYRTVGIVDQKNRWVAAKGRASFDDQGSACRFIGTVVDITDQKEAELGLQRAKVIAEDANRAKDQFLAMLSHELRTPLTPVLMTVASLQRDPLLSDDVQRDLEVIHRNVELEALLIDDLLDLTRIAHGKLELRRDAVDIHRLIDHALAISESDLVGKKLQVIRKFRAAEHQSWADSARLQQVFWNLIKNAVKFTPEGGRIEIKTCNDAAGHILIEIADNGIGIDPEVMPRIFNAFEQGSRRITSSYGGLGLGLAIAQRVVELHHGSIKASSGGQDQGAVFTLSLDAIATSLLDGPVTFPERKLGPHPGRILLVEDHEDTARMLRRMLERAGYRVSSAGSVAEAKARAGSESFDLLISDLGLPDGSGLELMRHLREHHPVPSIALSGFGTDDDVAATKAAGFLEHLTKPVDWERLKGTIERLVARATERPGAEV